MEGKIPSWPSWQACQYSWLNYKVVCFGQEKPLKTTDAGDLWSQISVSLINFVHWQFWMGKETRKDSHVYQLQWASRCDLIHWHWLVRSQLQFCTAYKTENHSCCVTNPSQALTVMSCVLIRHSTHLKCDLICPIRFIKMSWISTTNLKSLCSLAGVWWIW